MALKKIAYLVSQYPAVSHTFILREVRRLRALGLEIQTASVNAPDRPIEVLDVDEFEEAEKTFYIKKQGGFKAIKSTFKSLVTSPIRFLKGVRTVFSLVKWNLTALPRHVAYFVEAALLGEWMCSQKLDHVHVHFANPASTVALLMCDLFPMTFSLTVHGPDEFYEVTSNYLTEKMMRARFVFCISFFTQSQLMKISPFRDWHKFHVIRLGVDTDLFAPLFDPIRSDVCQILCIGRLVPAKGQHILVAAAEKLIKQGKKIHVHFIGGGPDRADLEADVSSRGLRHNIHFSGALNPQQVVDAYGLADIVVLPSFAEGLPVVLMEAMAMEIPCIASGINGIPELIRHNIDGLLVEPSNIEQLAQSLSLLVDDPTLRSRLGSHARIRIIEKYNLEENANLLFERFVEVASV